MRNRHAGFTVIELLVVILIIGVLAAIAIPTYLNQRAAAHDAQVTATTRPLVEDIEVLAGEAAGLISGDSGTDVLTVGTRALTHTTTTGVHWSAAGTTYDGYCVALWSDAGRKYTAATPLLYDSTSGATLPRGTSCATGNPPAVIGGSAPPAPHITVTYDLNAPGCDTTAVDLPTASSDPMTVNWGDGTTQLEAQGSYHVYASRGVYRVVIQADSFTAFKVNMAGNGNPACFVSLDEWVQNTGTISLYYGFAYAYNLTFVARPPVPVTNLSWAFAMALTFDGDVSGWDVSQCTSMPFTFRSAEEFTGKGIDTWDVSRMTGGTGIFYGAASFDADLSSWDTSRFTNLSSAFMADSSFTGKGLEHWDVSHVTNLANTFAYATAFNRDISHWDTHAVTNMNSMFSGASAFNQNLAGWNVSSVPASNHHNFDTGATAWTLPQPAFTG